MINLSLPGSDAEQPFRNRVMAVLFCITRYLFRTTRRSMGTASVSTGAVLSVLCQPVHCQSY
jgi:hypothetical protein